MLNMNAKFNLTRLAPHTQYAAPFDLSDAHVVDDQCKCPSSLRGKPRIIILQKESTKELFEFQFHEIDVHVSLQMIYHLDPSKHFKDIQDSGSVDLNMGKAKGLGTGFESYVCKTDEIVSFSDSRNEYRLVMDMSNVQVQAYGIVAGQFGIPFECSDDFSSSTMKTVSTSRQTSPTFTNATTAKSSIPSTKLSTMTSTKLTTSTMTPPPSPTHSSSMKPSTSQSTKTSSSSPPSTLTHIINSTTTHSTKASTLSSVTTHTPSTHPLSTITPSVTTQNATTASSPPSSSGSSPSTPKSSSTQTSPTSQSVSTHHSSASTRPSPSHSMSTGTSSMTSHSTRHSTQSSFTPTGSTSHKVTTRSQPTTRPTSSVITTEVTTPASVLPKFGLKDPDGQYYCIVLQGKIEFEIPYTTTDGKVSKLAIELPRNASVTGSCSVNGTNNTQEITLSFFNGWSFNLVIGTLTDETGLDTSTYSWEEIEMTYVLDDHFYQPKEKGKQMKVSTNPAFDDFKASSQGCFKCISRQAITINTVTMDLSDLEYFGFGHTDSEDFPTADVSECAADHAQTTMSPSTKSPSNSHGGAIAGGIVGGLAAIALIAVVVIVYRRRMNKAPPYEDL